MNVVIQLFLYDYNTCKNAVERSVKEYRIWEYCNTLLSNCADPNIKKLYVLCDTQEALEYYESIVSDYKDKVYLTVVGHQPTYKEIVEFIKGIIPPNEITCIMNADMFFNSEKDHQLIKRYLQPNHLFALTRHEITTEGHTVHTRESCPFTVYGGSCDTFIFYTPISEKVDVSTLDFKQNLFGAEGVFMKAWTDAGYELWNPCDDIITLHLHKDRIHFEKYATIDTPENSVSNSKTSLPPIPSHKEI